MTGPDGSTVNYTRDANGDLSEVKDPREYVTGLTYEDGHYLRQVDDPGPGFVRRLDYGSDGRLAKVTDATNAEVTLVTDPHARTEMVTGNEGRLTTLSTYDEFGNVSTLDQIHDGVVRRTTFSYDEHGRLLSRSNPNDPGLTWSAAYDSSGNVTAIREADGDQITLGYHSDGNLRSWTDGENRTTTYEYTNGVVSKISPPGRAPITLVSDQRGLVTNVQDPVAGNRSYTYDTAGHVLTETTPAGTTTWGYNAAGRTVSRSGVAGTATWTYDEVGNLRSQTTPEGTTTWTYDHNDNVTSASGPGGIVNYDYNSLGLIERADAGGASTSWTYEGDRIRTETTSEGTTTYTYDGARRQIAETGPGGDWSWDWDDRDRVTSLTRPDGSTASLSWHDDGRIREMADPDAGTWTYGWDDAGNLMEVAGPSEVRTYQRDELGQILGRTVTPVEAPIAPRSVARASAGVIAPTRTPLPPGSLDGLVPRPGELPRPPAGPTDPQERRRGGGGVLGEYAMLIDFALTNLPLVTAVGIETHNRLLFTLEMLTHPTSPVHRPPTDVSPTPDPEVPTDPETDPEEEEPDRPAPPRTNDCDPIPLPNSYGYGPTTYDGRSEPGVALADLYRFEPGTEPASNPVGWRGPQGPLFEGPALNRGHLIGKQFGGRGIYANLATMFATFNQKPYPGFRTGEEAVADAISECEVVFLDVELYYHAESADVLWGQNPPLLPVNLVSYVAVSTKGLVYSQVLANRDI